jgi:hypothetical protein
MTYHDDRTPRGTNVRRPTDRSMTWVAAFVVASLVIIGIVAYTSDRTKAAATGDTTTGRSVKITDTTNVPTETDDSATPEKADPKSRPQDIPFPVPNNAKPQADR